MSDEKIGKMNTREMACKVLGGCLFESVLTIWCRSLLAYIILVQNGYLAVRTSCETLCAS